MHQTNLYACSGCSVMFLNLAAQFSLYSEAPVDIARRKVLGITARKG